MTVAQIDVLAGSAKSDKRDEGNVTDLLMFSKMKVA